MKKLTASLQRGNLTPKERLLLLMQSHITKEKTGKAIMTEADKKALESWQARDNTEAREWNRYNDGWRTEGYMRLDAQTIYLNAEIILLRLGRIVDYAMWSNCDDIDRGYWGRYGKIDLDVNDDEVSELLLKNTALEFDKVVYGYAFQNLSDDLRQDILTLFPDAETESQYLDQEEVLADLFNGKENISIEVKDKLADSIVKHLYGRFAELLTKNGKEIDGWWLNGYYAELPALDIVKKWAYDNSISYEGNEEEIRDILFKKMQDYAYKKEVSVSEVLKETLLIWLDNGLFINDYIPIWDSIGKSTCNSKDTKLTHKEILKEWLKIKTKVKAELQKMIDYGQMKIENRERNFYGVKEIIKVITGTSLYNLKDDLIFVENFKRQINYFKPFGCLLIFLRNRDFISEYASLLGFTEINKKLSNIYGIDLDYKINKLMVDFGESVSNLNKELHYVAGTLEESIYKKHKIKFSMEFFIDDMLFHLDKVKPVIDETVKHYSDEFKKIFGDEF